MKGRWLGDKWKPKTVQIPSWALSSLLSSPAPGPSLSSLHANSQPGPREVGLGPRSPKQVLVRWLLPGPDSALRSAATFLFLGCQEGFMLLLLWWKQQSLLVKSSNRERGRGASIHGSSLSSASTHFSTPCQAWCCSAARVPGLGSQHSLTRMALRKLPNPRVPQFSHL